MARHSSKYNVGIRKKLRKIIKNSSGSAWRCKFIAKNTSKRLPFYYLALCVTNEPNKHWTNLKVIVLWLGLRFLIQ